MIFDDLMMLKSNVSEPEILCHNLMQEPTTATFPLKIHICLPP